MSHWYTQQLALELLAKVQSPAPCPSANQMLPPSNEQASQSLLEEGEGREPSKLGPITTNVHSGRSIAGMVALSKGRDAILLAFRSHA